MSTLFNPSLTWNPIPSERTIADRNRAQFDHWGVTCISLLSRPDAGTILLLEKTVAALNEKLEIAIISGEKNDKFFTETWRDFCIPTITIHSHVSGLLTAQQVAEGLSQLEEHCQPFDLDLILIENGEHFALSTPFSVGEHIQVGLVSIRDIVDESMDSLAIFKDADCILMTNIDFAPELEINLDRVQGYLNSINPTATLLPISANTGTGLAAWLNWVGLQVALRNQSAKAAKIENIRSKIPIRYSVAGKEE